MALDANELGYFITQVGLSAASFGVAASDVTDVANALTSYFDYRCLAPTAIVPGQGPQLNSICLASSCPLAPNHPTCFLYDLDHGSSPQPATYDQFTSSPAAMVPTTCPQVAASTVVVTTTVSVTATRKHW